MDKDRADDLSSVRTRIIEMSLYVRVNAGPVNVMYIATSRATGVDYKNA